MATELYPYTNYHDLNLDWIISKIRNIEDAETATEAAKLAAELAQELAEAAQEAAENAQEKAEDAQEAAEDAQEAAEDARDAAKNYADNIADPVAGLVTSWLADHVDPGTGYVIDTSLTIAGAAADAQETGLRIAFNEDMLNNYLSKSRCYLYDLCPTVPGVWSAGGNTYVTQISPGDEVVFRINSGVRTWYAFAIDPDFGAGNNISFASGYTQLVRLTTDTWQHYTAPSDAQWLIFVNDTGGQNYAPRSVYVNGIDVYDSLSENFKDSILHTGGQAYNATLPAVLSCDDLDNLPYNTIYAVLNAALSNVTGDIPFVNGFLIVSFNSINWAASGAVQIAVDLSNGETAVRCNTGSWSGWRYGKNTLYVGAGYTDDNQHFSTLLACCEFIVTNQLFDATVIVEPGTYDLVTEFTQAYLDSFTYSGKAIGLAIGNNTHFIFQEGAEVVFNYTGTNNDTKHYFSPFNVYGSFELENAVIKCTNGRYCVHEDIPTLLDFQWIPDAYTAKYTNCRMTHNGNDFTALDFIPVCIGAGCQRNSLSIIDGGVFICPGTTSPRAIAYHNFDTGIYGNYPSRVIVRDAYTSNGVRFTDYANSSVEAEVSGCRMPNGHSTGMTYFDVKAWNNVT